MRLSARLWLIRRDVLSQKMRLFILLLCITLSAAIFGIVFSAFLYIRQEVRPRLRSMFPERRVLVRPSATDAFFFRMEGPKITEQMTEQFLAMPEVEKIHRQLSASFPVSADFNIETFNVGFTTDVILLGVDRELVADALAPGAQFPPPPDAKEIPVVVSEYFVDAYNLGFAESANLPKLAPKAVRGVHFELMLGESTLDIGTAIKSKPMRLMDARIAGLTDNPNLFGLTIPIEMLIAFNKEFNPAKPIGYSLLHIDLAIPEGADAVEAKAKELNLGFEAQKEKLDRYLRVVLTVEALLAAGLTVVLLLAGIGTFTTTAASVRERRPAWGLHRATGLGPGGIAMLATGHALAAAIPAALIACGICIGLSQWLTAAWGEKLESLSIIPTDVFKMTALGLAATALLAILMAIIPAWIFAFPIMRSRPVDLLSERSL